METRIKERLVGAIALVVIVVVVVPELLTGPRATTPVAGAPAAQTPVRTVRIDLATGERGAIARAPAESLGAAAGPPASAAEPPGGVRPEPVTTPTGPPTATPMPASSPPPTTGAASRQSAARGRAAAVVPTAPAPAKAPAAEASAAPPAVAPKRAATPARAGDGAEGWVVQLGSFASQENAERLATGLRAKGFRAFVSEFRGSARVLYRVRVGPEQDRARADAIAARLAHEGHRGTVAPQP